MDINGGLIIIPALKDNLQICVSYQNFNIYIFLIKIFISFKLIDKKI